jgi:hypothetical protein
LTNVCGFHKKLFIFSFKQIFSKKDYSKINIHQMKITGYLIFISFVLLNLHGYGQSDSTTALNQSGDSTTAHKRRFLILPIVINSPETKFGAGAVAAYFFKTTNDPAVRTSNVEVVGLYTQRKQTLIQMGGSVYFPKENYIFRYFGSYANFPDKFWGIGNNTPEANKELYTYRQLYINAQLTKRVHKRLYVGLVYELQSLIDVQFASNGIFESQNVLGRNGGIASGLGPIVAWDSRNNAFAPTKGDYFQFSQLNYGNLTGSNFNFASYLFDYRKFILTFKRNVLALQGIAQFTSGTVPFRELPTIGGPFLMRGYYLGRFRDKNLLSVQAEYRVPVWWRFGVVAFGGVGEVANTVNNFNINGLKYSAGGGIRFAIIPKEKLNIRLDYAFGQNSTGFYLYIMEAF